MSSSTPYNTPEYVRKRLREQRARDASSRAGDDPISASHRSNPRAFEASLSSAAADALNAVRAQIVREKAAVAPPVPAKASVLDSARHGIGAFVARTLSRYIEPHSWEAASFWRVVTPEGLVRVFTTREAAFSSAQDGETVEQGYQCCGMDWRKATAPTTVPRVHGKIRGWLDWQLIRLGLRNAR